MANGAQTLLGGAYLVALGRLLGPANFGIFSVVAAIVMVAGLLLELRIQDVVARDFCLVGDQSSGRIDDGAKIIDLFILEVLSRALPSLGLVILSHLLTQSSHLPPSTYTLVILAAAGFFVAKSGWGASTGMLRVLGRTDLIALCMTADWGLRLILTLCYSALIGLSIQGALVIALLAGGFCNLAQVVLACREFNRHVGTISLAGWSARGAMARSRSSLRLVVANFGVSASDLMAKDLDVAMISSLVSADSVGLYKLAKGFAQMIWRGIDPFYLAIMPEVRRLWVEKNISALKLLIAKTSVRLLALSLAFVCVAYVLVVLFADRILGAGYPGLPSLMLMMSVWIILCAPLVWAHPLAVAINRPELAVAGGLLGSTVGLAAFWMLTPTLGLVGAAIAWSLTVITGFLFIAVTSLQLSNLLRIWK